MSYTDWKDKVNGFKKMDVRGVAGNFLEGIKKQAASLPERLLKIFPMIGSVLFAAWEKTCL